MKILSASRNGRNWLWLVLGDEHKNRQQEEYIVQFIRESHQRRWICECRDFLIRRFKKKKVCKHCRYVLEQVRLAGGPSKLQRLIEMGHLPHDGREQESVSRIILA